MNHSLFAAGCLAFSLGLSQAPASHAQAVVDDSYNEYVLSWNGTTTKWIARWRPFAVDGKIQICGAATRTSAKLSHLTRDAVRDLKIAVDDAVIVSDLNYFTKVRRQGDLMGSEASCKLSSVPVSAAEGDWSIGSSKKRYRNY